MNHLHILSTFLLAIFSHITFAQTAQGNCVIKFTYDAAGNRIKRVESCGGLIPKASEADMANASANEESNEAIAQKPNDDLEIAVLFPNPTSSTCIVSLNKEVTNATLALFDNQGKQVHYERVSGKDLPLNLSSFSAGSYIVIVRTENRAVHKTVVKN